MEQVDCIDYGKIFGWKDKYLQQTVQIMIELLDWKYNY